MTTKKTAEKALSKLIERSSFRHSEWLGTKYETMKLASATEKVQSEKIFWQIFWKSWDIQTWRE